LLILGSGKFFLGGKLALCGTCTNLIFGGGGYLSCGEFNYWVWLARLYVAVASYPANLTLGKLILGGIGGRNNKLNLGGIDGDFNIGWGIINLWGKIIAVRRNP